MILRVLAIQIDYLYLYETYQRLAENAIVLLMRNTRECVVCCLPRQCQVHVQHIECIDAD